VKLTVTNFFIDFANLKAVNHFSGVEVHDKQPE